MKMKPSLYLSITVLSAASFLVAGCSGELDSTGSEGTTGTLSSSIGIDISKVASFIIAPGDSFADRSSPGGAGMRALDSFFKLEFFLQKAYASATSGLLYAETTDGVVQAINLANGSNNYQISDVINTNTYLFLVANGIAYNGTTCNMIAVHKVDGALYCVPISPYCKTIQQPNATTDVFYIQSSVTTISKIDLSVPASATVSTAVTTGSNLVSSGAWDILNPPFAVNSDGDVLVYVSQAGANGAIQIFKASGGIQNIATVSSNSTLFLQGIGSGDTANFYGIYGLTIALNKITKSSGSFSVSTLESVGALESGVSNGVASLITVAGSYYIVPNVQNSKFYRMATTATTSTGYTPPGLTSIQQIVGAPDGTSLLVLGKDSSGNSGIDKFTLSGEAFSVLVAPGLYTISNLSVGASGVATFSGQRNSDGANIVGSISTSGTVSVVATPVGATSVQSIVRIQ